MRAGASEPVVSIHTGTYRRLLSACHHWIVGRPLNDKRASFCRRQRRRVVGGAHVRRHPTEQGATCGTVRRVHRTVAEADTTGRSQPGVTRTSLHKPTSKHVMCLPAERDQRDPANRRDVADSLPSAVSLACSPFPQPPPCPSAFRPASARSSLSRPSLAGHARAPFFAPIECIHFLPSSRLFLRLQSALYPRACLFQHSD